MDRVDVDWMRELSANKTPSAPQSPTPPGRSRLAFADGASSKFTAKGAVPGESVVPQQQKKRFGLW